MNLGDPLVWIARQWHNWSRAFALLILGVLILAPLLLVASRGATLSGAYEESIGYRYFYSLRTVQGERAVLFLPQGQIQDLLSQAIQIALSFAGYPFDDTAGRIDAFSYSLIACAMLLALFGFGFGNAEESEGPIACLLAATLWGSVFYLPGYNTVYALLQPDYLPFILAIGIGANVLVARFALGTSIVPWRDTLVFGLFLGLCLATKFTLVVFAAVALTVYVIERPRWRALLVVAGAGLFGIGIWLAAIKLDYRGSGTALREYFGYLASAVQAPGGVPKQGIDIFRWAYSKLNPDSYLHGALVMLPALAAAAALFCPRARRSVLVSVFVASVVYCYALYERDYPGTNMEIAVFVCFAFLCLWRELRRHCSGVLGKRVTACVSVAVIGLGLVVDTTVFRSTVLSIVGSAVANTTAQSQLRAALNTLPKPILWLVPTNDERTLTVYSAIMKGSRSIAVSPNVESETMRAISPDLDFVAGPVMQRTRRNVGEYNTIMFATNQPTDEPSILAIQRTYNLDLSGFSCGQFAAVSPFRILGCLHRRIEPRAAGSQQPRRFP